MSAAVLDRAPSPASAPWRDGRGPLRREAPVPAAPETYVPAREAASPTSSTATVTAGVGGQGRLEDVLSGVWEDLVAHRPAACPVCGAQLTPRYGAAGTVPVGGRCGGCGSVLG